MQEGEEEGNPVKTASASSSPTPPPSKRKKVTQISIPNSPKTPAQTPSKTKTKPPAIRNTRTMTPATKMTLTMKRTLNFKPTTPTPKKFTIGRKAIRRRRLRLAS